MPDPTPISAESMPDGEWKSASVAPPMNGRLLAVEDGPVTCHWHFATFIEDGRWIDLSSGEVFVPTHWMRLPLVPSEMSAHA